MSLRPGARFGSYRIVDRLGEGGMGEVYRARDTRLDRDVAVKILPDAFVGDPERLVRFEREAKTLASLNHPHIAQIHGFESTEDVRAIVMELVEGEDLSARLTRGPLALDDALPIARQIAEALDAAHAAGVIHRDLKPANVKVRSDGTVKVLDFGLAKLTAPNRDGAGGPSAESMTVTSPAMTQAGMIFGTAAYMAPEQAKGRTVDKRADIWAFGCVFYELITGRRLFAGEDVPETLAAVLRAEIDWATLPAATPEPIRRLLRRCLVRDPRNRIPDIGVARIEIDEALTASPSKNESRQSRRFAAVASVATIGVVLLATFAVAPWGRSDVRIDSEPRVLQVKTAEGIASPTIAPDGRAVVFVEDGRLVVRSLDTGTDVELSGTDGASNPVWSPDSRNIAYFGTGEAGAELRVVPAGGGTSRIVVRDSLRDAARVGPFPVFGAAWCAAGILYISNARELRLVSDSGQDRLFAAAESERDFRGLAFPHCLSDGRVLAVQRRADLRASRPNWGTTSIVVMTPTARTVLLELPASNNVAVRSPIMAGQTHILFERQDQNQGIWALPVTANLSARTAPERLVLPGASRPSAAGGLLTALSGVTFRDRELVWVDRAGERLGTFGRPQREFLTPTLSPDGTQVATAGRRMEADEIWIHRQDTVAKWLDSEAGGWPTWSPDGRHIAYVSGARNAIVVRTVRGTDPRHFEVPGAAYSLAGPTWTADARAVIYQTDRGLSLTPVFAPATRGQLLDTGREPAISPNGRFMAYASLSTGRSEVYLTTFPKAGEAVPISIEGGRFPRWNSSGDELFFPCGPTFGEDPQSSRYLCMAPIDVSTGERRASPVRLFDAAARGLLLSTYGQRGYDVAPDGSRILLQTRGVVGTPSITLIEDVDAWLQRTAR